LSATLKKHSTSQNYCEAYEVPYKRMMRRKDEKMSVKGLFSTLSI
jgi:hypothetical protein